MGDIPCAVCGTVDDTHNTHMHVHPEWYVAQIAVNRAANQAARAGEED